VTAAPHNGDGMARALLILGVLGVAAIFAWQFAGEDAARTGRETPGATPSRRPQDRPGEVAVEPGAKRTELRGVVTGDEDRPLDGVDVIVPLGTGAPELRTRTGADGTFALDVPSSESLRVRLAHPDYVGRVVWGQPGHVDTFRLERGAPFTVVVLDPDAKPVPGAQVRTLHLESDRDAGLWFGTDEEGIGAAVTGADGRAALGALPTTPFELRVEHPKFAEHVEQVELREIRPVEHVVRLDLGGRVEGTVFDPKGEPLAGALAEAGGRSAYSDATGHYSIGCVGVGFVTVRASKEGFGPGFFGERLGWADPVPVEIRAGAAATGIDIALGAPSYVTGRVADPDGAPVAGASVSLNSKGAFTRATEFRTGEDGRFRAGPFSVFRRAEAHVYVRADGFWSGNSKRDALAPGASLDVGTVTLARSAIVRGRCVDAGGDAVEGARVEVVPGSASARSGEDGSFELTGLPAGEVVLLARREGLASARVTLDVGVGEDVVLKLLPSLTISGRVTSGEGAPRAEIVLVAKDLELPAQYRALSLHSAISDEDGQYAFGGLGPGRYSIAILGYGRYTIFGTLPAGESRTVEAGASDVDFTFPFTGGVVTARVVSRRTGRPIPKFGYTTLRYRDGLPDWDDVGDRDDPDGLLRVEFAAEGKWAIEFRAPGHAPYRTPVLDLKKGEEKDLGAVRLGEGGVIAGRVLDAQGRAVPFARVHVLSAKFETIEPAPFTGADGGYSVGGVSPGLYSVFAISPRHPIGVVKHVEVAEGATATAEVRFAEPAPLEVVVRGADGRAVAGARLVWTFRAIAPMTSEMLEEEIPPGHGDPVADDEGRILQRGLPPGPVTLFVAAPGCATVTRDVQLSAGRSTRVEVTLTPEKN